jgi:hypothetical protein
MLAVSQKKFEFLNSLLRIFLQAAHSHQSLKRSVFKIEEIVCRGTALTENISVPLFKKIS